jgi:hypothetical protein
MISVRMTSPGCGGLNIGMVFSFISGNPQGSRRRFRLPQRGRGDLFIADARSHPNATRTGRPPKHQPVAMLPASVVRVFPFRIFRIDDGTAPDLDDAVARTEASLSRSFNEVHMRPIISVMMNVVGDLAQQDSFRL